MAKERLKYFLCMDLYLRPKLSGRFTVESSQEREAHMNRSPRTFHLRQERGNNLRGKKEPQMRLRQRELGGEN